MIKIVWSILKMMITKGGDHMMFVALAINIINGYMNFSDLKPKKVKAKVQEQLELLVTDTKELQELLSK
ncbi:MULTISPECIES: hypothetical protein [unclassified Granulicatella]|uniref:CD1375 family protein n=1 Tax=unclassified Granulicatella TaxID=2630493 RepID=UPI0010738769|nr:MULTISPECIES: hypothetical protein [unclassified Granulicatella]MBF0780521.1 hypothetical protein [Granulicatella sp. 19428wC4_WM01]TFU95335.1 hypothetical protein E4T68_05375 [Granulicatella sp. WM01]